jgi:hypothetical protein
MRSPSGRLIGAVLELSKGHQLLLVSAYMSSGLDHHAPSSEQHDAARALYAELLGWTAGMQQDFFFFFFFFIFFFKWQKEICYMAMISHKTKLQRKLSKSLSHAASSGSMQSKFGMPKGATGQSPVLR